MTTIGRIKAITITTPIPLTAAGALVGPAAGDLARDRDRDIAQQPAVAATATEAEVQVDIRQRAIAALVLLATPLLRHTPIRAAVVVVMVIIMVVVAMEVGRTLHLVNLETLDTPIMGRGDSAKN